MKKAEKKEERKKGLTEGGLQIASLESQKRLVRRAGRKGEKREGEGYDAGNEIYTFLNLCLNTKKTGGPGKGKEGRGQMFGDFLSQSETGKTKNEQEPWRERGGGRGKEEWSVDYLNTFLIISRADRESGRREKKRQRGGRSSRFSTLFHNYREERKKEAKGKRERGGTAVTCCIRWCSATWEKGSQEEERRGRGIYGDICPTLSF